MSTAPTPFDRLLEREANRGALEASDLRLTRGRTSSPVDSPSLMLLVFLATAGVLAYCLFLLNPANRGDLLPWLMVVCAEIVVVFHALVAMWTILSSNEDPRGFGFYQAQRALYDTDRITRRGQQLKPHEWRMFLDREETSVDVFITTYGEDLAVIERTLRACLELQGRHETWVLDDGRSDEVRDLVARVGGRYVRRLSSHGAKAGNVNHALTISNAPFFAIFDADFVPEPEFLFETVPFFENPQVAFVQTPQTYGNLTSVISRGAGYMQSVFYRFIQPGRNKFNAAFCVGTNVIFRRAAIDEIGGMYTDSKSEDVWTSLALHEKGWKSIYIPNALAVGDTPETIEAYTKQQQRWATGGFEILLTHHPFSPRRSLTFDQRLQYFVTATHYLTGIAPLILLLVPPLQIYLDLAPMSTSISPAMWVVYYCGFYVMQIAVAFVTLGSFRWEVLLLASVSFPIYVRAWWSAVLRRDQKWHVTGALGRRATPFAFIVPQLVMFVFLLITSVVGVLKQDHTGVFTLALAWNITNTLILLGLIVQAGVEERARRAAPASLADLPPAPPEPSPALVSAQLEPSHAVEHDLVAPGAPPLPTRASLRRAAGSSRRVATQTQGA